MKNNILLFTLLTIVICLLMLCNCKPKGEKVMTIIKACDSNSVFMAQKDSIQDSLRDTLGNTLPISAVNLENITENNISNDSLSNVERKYQLLREMWQEDESDNKIASDNIFSNLGKAPSLYAICSLATRSMRLKVGLDSEPNTDNLADSVDSLNYVPVENEAYMAILEYQKLLSSGIQLKGEIPSVIRHKTQKFKNSLQILPKVKASSFLKDRNFFFIGGGSFIRRYESGSGKYIFNDPDNNPEIRL